ncbi:hypothetical protein QN277_007420 [Acacia crassicarpa]|nr:hypothetical protein QN277_007420 [Acacia crassicarpa]
MVDPFSGAAVGFVFSQLGNEVKEAIKRVKAFRPELMKLEETLKDLDSMIEDIKKMSQELNESAGKEVERLTSIMTKGKELVSKCHRISWWNPLKKASHQTKLVGLDNEITRFMNLHIKMGTFLAVKKVQVKLSRFDERFDKLSNQIESLRRTDEPDEVDNGVEASDEENDNKAPRIGPFALIIFVLFGGVHIHILVKITAIGIIIYKAVEAIKRCLSEKSLTAVWSDFFDLSFLRSFVPSPNSRASSVATGLILLLVYSIGGEIQKITIICYILSQGGLEMVIEDLGMLETTIKQLEDTMKSLDQVPKEIESTKEAAESLTSWLEEGKKLVSETSTIGWWNFVKKWQYQKKMVELENKLLRFHSLYLRAQLVKNDDKTSEDDSEMKDNESSKPVHYDEDGYEMKRRHTESGENKSYDMLINNVNRYQFLDKDPSIPSSIIGGIQHKALGS